MTSSQQLTSNKKVQEQALHWFTRIQSEAMNDDEQTKFKQWCAIDEHARYYDEIELFWNSTEFTIAAQQINQKQISIANKNTQHFFNKKIGAIAASLLFIVTMSFNSINLQFTADYLTAIGEQQLLDLDDGSKLTLNTDSAVKIEFNKKIRKVNLLAGEVYFDVKKDPAGRPFHVYVDDVVVEVLGTRFSVQQMNDGVVVKGHSGHITVSSDSYKSQAITAGEQVQIKDERFFSDNFEPEQEFAWLNNRLNFKNKPLKEVMIELDRYYVGKILVLDSVASNTLITGSYSLVDPVKTAASISKIVNLKKLEISPWLLIIR